MTTVVELDGVSEPPLRALQWRAGPGMHVLLAEGRDGAERVVELVSGLRRPRRGHVRVAGTDPARSPTTRRRIASLLVRETLIDAPSVRESLALELALRGAKLDAAAVLDDWGLGRLKTSRVSALEPAECRALGLATALSLPDPILLALVEPFADNAGLSRERIRQRLLALSEKTCVLCVTAVPRDAVELGGSLFLVRSAGLEPVTLPMAEPLASLFGYRVVSCARPRDLVAALAGEPAVAGLEWRDHAGDRVLVWGPDEQRLSLAVVRAARTSNAGLYSIVPARASLELVHAAQNGWARATQERAWWLARGGGAASSASNPRGEGLP
jgi:ABC-type taurine transport system ATPase subunit